MKTVIVLTNDPFKISCIHQSTKHHILLVHACTALQMHLADRHTLERARFTNLLTTQACVPSVLW